MMVDLGSALVFALLLFLIVLSVLGNTLVCVAVATDPQLRKLSNLFIASLALADLLVAGVVMPFALLNDFFTWTLGETMCQLWIASDVMCSTASIINLCAISFDRYIHIKDPLQYTEWLTRKTIPASIACIWATSALISFLPISLNWHKADPSEDNELNEQIFSNKSASRIGGQLINNESSSDGEMTSCALNFNPSYSIVSSLVSFFLPCLIMVSIYFHVYRVARGHVEMMRAQQKPLIRLRGHLTPTNHNRSNETGIAPNGPEANGPQHLSPRHSDRSASLCDIHRVVRHDDFNGTLRSNASSARLSPPLQKSTVDCSGSTRRLESILHQVQHPHVLQEHKAAITIGIIMGIFMLCWTPFFIVNVISGVCKDCVPGMLFKVLSWLGYSNSAFNPIIYSIFNVEFRQAFARILSHRRPRKWPNCLGKGVQL